jgi:hypothetical protein
MKARRHANSTLIFLDRQLKNFSDSVWKHSIGSLHWEAPGTQTRSSLRACFRRTRSALIACGHEQPTLP